MYDLGTFSISDKVPCAAALRNCGNEVATVREAAECVVRYLHENLGDGQSGRRACPLVRLYKTFAYDQLDAERQAFARLQLDVSPPPPQMKCLSLLATAGERHAWNSIDESARHKVIPLPSEQIVRQSPMISQLIHQLGLEISAVLHPDLSIIGDLEQRQYNVFYVPSARNSPYIPAQEDFVIPYSIESALGFGGLFATGDLFAVILFSRVFIPHEVALTFKTFALSVKSALLAPGLAGDTGGAFSARPSAS